jgi:hypothetical protein
MVTRAAGVLAIVISCFCSGMASAGAQEASQEVWSPGRIIGDIGESSGLHVKVPPAPAFVVKSRPPEWELDYRPLEPTQAEPPPDVNAAARAVGKELDAARAANRRLATGVPAPASRIQTDRPKKGIDPFDASDDAATN